MISQQYTNNGTSFTYEESPTDGYYATGPGHRRSSRHNIGTSNEERHRREAINNSGRGLVDWSVFQLDVPDANFAPNSTDPTNFAGAQFLGQHGDTSLQGGNGIGGEDCFGFEQTGIPDNAHGAANWLGLPSDAFHHGQPSRYMDQARFDGSQSYTHSLPLPEHTHVSRHTATPVRTLGNRVTL
ncbi:hypothetical protein LTS16_015362 [Friedmanniomyces endolithicus]|uniref:Uncharacterized protein n=1 Tax=Friedmanniomyces endolithicus TaxID=329885 RepID=A0A4U0UT05_9PEZI|nr:hypothetical protein LTR82_007915 [Friedmanniomyces endolithicus]KAK0977687.1 hypothetical protein LTR54_016138 [Friedmanniomyces endolithicus]KAK1034538.1 hypothetical protein LTS16_015362 [Friedmanniomyces endolithicus]TKA38592.1 hypothetical protein B0A54_09527 [Friedmanniomyces endolithicus]